MSYVKLKTFFYQNKNIQTEVTIPVYISLNSLLSLCCIALLCRKALKSQRTLTISTKKKGYKIALTIICTHSNGN